MNTLDSRFLRRGDCFAQKFLKAGTLDYFIDSGSPVPDILGRSPNRQKLSIEVTPDKKDTPEYYYIEVKRGTHGFAVEKEQIKVAVGETVLWFTADPLAAFTVAGGAADFTFSSARLRNEAIYTHAFGTSGTYEWADPVNREATGVVEVRAVKPSKAEEWQTWYDLLKKPHSFEIRNGRVITSAKVEIVVGQTVFWKVWDDVEISVVDTHLGI